MLKIQIGFYSGYNRNGAELILIEIQRDHRIPAYDQLVNEFDIETHFGLKPGEELKI